MSSQNAPQSGTGHDPTKSEQFAELIRCLTRPVLTVGLAAIWLYEELNGMSTSGELKTLAVGLITWWFADRARKE